MADWFSQNAPKGQDWFTANAPQQTPEPKTAGGFLDNAINSAVNTVGGMAHAVAHPIDTISAAANLADGAAQTYIPGVAKLEQMGGTDPAVQAKQQAMAKAFVDNLKQRYGSADAALNTLYHDPVGVLADASTFVDPAAAIGKVAGLAARAGIASNKAAAVARVAGDLSKANPSVALAKSTLDPAEQAAVDFARTNNIPLDAATQTGSGALRRIQNISGAQLGAGRIVKDATDATKAGLQNAADSLLNQASPVAHTEETAGQGVTDALNTLKNSQAQQAGGHYAALEQIEADPANAKTVTTSVQQVPTGVVGPNGQPILRTVAQQKTVPLPVDLTATKQALQPLYDTLKQQMPIAQQQASKGLTALHNLLDSDDVVPASVAESALGAIKSLQREDISPQNKFILSKAIDATQPTIDSAVAAAGLNALDALQQGRALTKAKYATQATMDNLRTDEPVKLFNQLTQAKDSNINLLRDVASKAPDAMPAIGRAFIEGLMDQATAEAGTARPGSALTKWNSLGDQTKNILFPNPALRSNLDNFFVLTKKLAENPNPSGTAATAGAMAAGGLLLAHPLLGGPLLIGNRVLAKALYSPKTTNALTTALTVPIGSATQKAITAARILHGLAQTSSDPVAK